MVQKFHQSAILIGNSSTVCYWISQENRNHNSIYCIVDSRSSETNVNSEFNISALHPLAQVWCLLISSDSWSTELKDVSNELVKTITQLIPFRGVL